MTPSDIVPFYATLAHLFTYAPVIVVIALLGAIVWSRTRS